MKGWRHAGTEILVLGIAFAAALDGVSAEDALPASTGEVGTIAAADPPPTPFPDRVILTWRGDPATTQAVTWRTDASVREAFAQLARAVASPDLEEDARLFTAQTTPLEVGTDTVCYHAVDFDGLLPETLYAYRVGSTAGWSEWFQFRTASREGPFSFLFLGDAQTDIHSLWSRVVRAAYAAAPQARFIIHAGDLVSHGDDDAQWEGWFRAGGWIPAVVSNIPAVGNHEYLRKAGGPRELSPFWRAQFTLPENGVPGLEELNYFIEYQEALIVVLDSYREEAAQAAWLDSILGTRSPRWTIACFHEPIYSAAKDRDNAEMRALWQPVLEKHGVDLVLQGHDHVYARGKRPAEEGTAGGGGPVYVVSVSGPKMYAAAEGRWMERVGENTQLYQIVTVGSDTLRYEARTVTGERFDAFELIRPRGE